MIELLLIFGLPAAIIAQVCGETARKEFHPDATPERAAQVRAEFQARLKQIKQEADIRQAERNGRGGSRQSKNY